MSKENTEYDVRIALYDGTKNPLANVVFFNDGELLLECNRVTVVRDGNRLYFHKGDKIAGSIKLSGRDKNILQLWKDFSKVRDLEGKYDMKYDKDLDLYYIDKDNKLSDYEHRCTLKGTKQLNHNPGDRAKRGEIIMAPVLTEKGKKMVEVAQKQKKETNKNVVVRALVTLLKTQVVGNDDALSTIDALEKFI